MATSASGDASYLWRINTEPPSFLFGTIHVPYKMVWDAIPNNAKLAFAVKYRVVQLVKDNLLLTKQYEICALLVVLLVCKRIVVFHD